MESSCDSTKPPMATAIPTMLCHCNFSWSNKNEMNAVIMGIRFVKMFALTAPSFFTPLVYSKKARDEANIASSNTGMAAFTDSIEEFQSFTS